MVIINTQVIPHVLSETFAAYWINCVRLGAEPSNTKPGVGFKKTQPQTTFLLFCFL